MSRCVSTLVLVATFTGACADDSIPTSPATVRGSLPVTSLTAGGAASIRELGALTSGGFSAAMAINNDGLVVGYSGSFRDYCCSAALIQPHGFVWDPATGAMRDIGISTANYGWGIWSRATAISANGRIAGYTRDMYWDGRAFLFTSNAADVLSRAPWDPMNASTYTMRVFPEFLFHTVPTDINSAGTVVGYGTGEPQRPFLWTAAGGYVTLPTPAPGHANATGMTESGVIVGWGQSAGTTRPLRWGAGTLAVEDLGLPSGYSSGAAHDVNSAGVIVGSVRNASEERAFTWNPDSHAFTLLPTLGGTTTRALAINAEGIVVGLAATAGGVQHAFAWDAISGAMLDLGTLPGDTYSEARSVNDHGQIVGRSTRSGFERAVLWTVTFVRDHTPPLIVANVVGTEGRDGWYRSNVSVEWSVTDPESAVRPFDCGTQSITSDTPGQIFSCTATSDGGTSSTTVSVKRDATSPVVAFSPAAATYEVDQAIDVHCSASDALSGIADADCPALQAPAYTLGAGTTRLTASATDRAGNSAVASAAITVIVSHRGICALARQFAIQDGVANSLCVKLENARKSTARGAAEAAAGQIRAFVNEVEAQSGKAFTVSQAAILVRLAGSV